MSEPGPTAGDVGRLAAAVEALTAVVHTLAAEQRRLRHHLETQADEGLHPDDRNVLAALVPLYRPGDRFTSAEVATLAEHRFGARADLRQALKSASCLDAHRIGMVLRRLAKSRTTVDNVRVVAMKTEGNARLWALEGDSGD